MKTSLQLLLVCMLSIGQLLNAQCEIAENFDTYANGTVPTNWTMINNTDGTSLVYGQVTSNPSAPSPGKYFRMYSGNATTGDLIFISPLNATTSDGNHRVKFYLQGFGGSSLILGTINANDGSGTLTPITTLVPSSNWTYYEIAIPAGTDQYMAFQHDLATTNSQVNLDSICVEVIPTCLEVSNIVMSNPTETTVDLSWNESNSNEDAWEYVVQEVGTGVPTTNGTAYTSTSTTPSLTVDNLEMDTEYEAYVRANCGGGDYGAWIMAAATLRTDCGIITANYCEDFVGIPDNTVPFCWSVEDDPGSGGHAYVDYEFSYSKNMFELHVVSSTVGNIMAISPDVTFATDGTHRLKFTAGASDASPDLLEVGTIDGSGSFVQITTLTLNSDRNTQYIVDLPNNGHANYAFKHGGTINKYVWINEVCIEDIPSCLEVSDVEANNVQYNSAEISWTGSGSSEIAWEYLILEASAPSPGPSDSGTEVSTNAATVPLSQNTDYIAYVRAKCSTTDFGAWIASEVFTSACSSFTAEYYDSFEGPNVSSEEIKPCWSVYDTTIGDFKTYGNSFGINPFEGNLQLRIYFPSSADPEGLVLISPEFADLNVDKQIRFRMNKRTGNEADMNILIGTVASPTDMASFQVIDNTSLNQSTVVADTWTEFTIDFSTYDTNLNHKYIAIKPQHSGTGATQYVFMDDFNYEFNPVQGFNDEPYTSNVLTASTDYTCNNAIIGDFAGATQSADFPCTGPTYSNFNDLWYRFIPTESGEYAFATENVTGEDVSMFVFEGYTGNFTALSGGCSTRYTIQNLNAGQTYFVSVASDVETAQFSLCVYKMPEVPANDEPIGAFSITESNNNSCNNAVSGYTASSTHSADSECGATTNDVWYTFVPNSTANYTFRRDIINGGGVTSLSVYEGTPGNLTQVTENCTSYLQTVDLVAGETYYVAVSSSATSIPVFFELCVYPSPPAPSNDECSAAIPLTAGLDFNSSFVIGDNTSATRNPNDPIPSCDNLEFDIKGKDVWYSVEIPQSGRLVLETKTNNDPYLWDPGMQAYLGPCDDLNSLVCSSDEGEGFFNYIELTDMQPGTEILVRVWGRVGTFGTYKIAAYDDSPVCSFPTDVEVTDITPETALLSWTAPSPAPVGGYEYIVLPGGSVYPGASSGIQTNDTEVLLEGLNPETTYDVYVKSLCGTNGSAWEGPITFTTTMILGNSDFDTQKIVFYPNPVTDILQVSFPETIKTITVYNLTGQILQQTKIEATDGQINMSQLSTGMYLLEAETENGRIPFKVFVK
ncbi:fibronectin type III domain-containing protein [Constantimarinum furrinae]|uniref:CHU large protein uncharacterized n=1 Tax=Constantimarinum furrinae TaxID=2562285 RepID=A0A7G8PVQ8_9FLAO|nr:fibronectin type III domain-containing protein [Constantimarinum furrinae]QNJ98424.1 CHU large protein uncharacterized [Constantimarinum furrinae]